MINRPWKHEPGELPERVKQVVQRVESNKHGVAALEHAIDWLASFSRQANTELERSHKRLSAGIRAAEVRGRAARRARDLRKGAQAAIEIRRMLERVLRAQKALEEDK